MDKLKVMGFLPTPSTILFDDPHTQISPPPKKKSRHMHKKMRKGCGNDYIKAFGAIYWAKKLFFKES